MISRYLSKISGPLLDRMDLNITVKPVEKGLLVAGARGESSEDISRRVSAARDLQRERFRNEGIYTNAQMDAKHLNLYCPLGKREKEFMERVMDKLSLSARGYGRILRVSRTIADLAGADKISVNHISEALLYRFQDFL